MPFDALALVPSLVRRTAAVSTVMKAQIVPVGTVNCVLVVIASPNCAVPADAKVPDLVVGPVLDEGHATQGTVGLPLAHC